MENENKVNNSKKPIIIKWIITVILLAGVLIVYLFHKKIYGTSAWFKNNKIDDVVVSKIVGWIPSLITCVVTWICAYFLIQIIKVVTDLIFKNSTNKTKTIMTLIRSLLKWIIIIGALIIMLQGFGVDMSTLLAGIGIIALIIGLGAQQIVADVLAGFFIVFEEEYKVGDIITIDGWRGTVIDIGIRVTKIVDAGGNIKIINNSDIKSVINQTAELSIARCVMSIDYEDNIQEVELVIKNNLSRIKEKIPAIVEGPYYKGISNLSASSVDLLFMAKVKEVDIYQAQRDMNRELYLIFNEYGISIPFSQVVVSQRDFKTPKRYVSKGEETKRESKANDFVNEQKELSKDISENENEI